MSQSAHLMSMRLLIPLGPSSGDNSMFMPRPDSPQPPIEDAASIDVARVLIG